MAPPEPRGPASPASRGSGFGASLRLLACLLLLGLGATLGWQARGLLQARTPSEDPEARRLRQRQELISAGWKPLEGGVFVRPCQAPCRPPRIYGGGSAAAVEVECLERNCGMISARFALLDRQGVVLGELPVQRQGRQGERLQLVAESADPRVTRMELSSITARAVENGG